MKNRAVAICALDAPIAASPAIAMPKVAIDPVVEATVPARYGAIFSDLEILTLPMRFCL